VSTFEIKFCTHCGSAVRLEIPDGDNRCRHVCGVCGRIQYVNPRIVVGAVCVWDGRILMCRRAIEPRIGFWTIPTGFLEVGESAEEGAAREVLEEACAAVDIEGLLGAYSVPHIGQVHLMFHGRMRTPDHAAGSESLETMLVVWEEIPWADLAFPSVDWALKRYQDSLSDKPKTGTTGSFRAPPKSG
jgi:ADP-ribose pyrophosphatase YjhB (NUDIX family)